MHRCCGYGLLCEISKSVPDEEYFLAHIARIENRYAKQPTPALMSMAGALMGIGMRSKKLNPAA